MSQQFTKKELYGGALTADLPAGVVDASDLRPVPDHQEIFLRQDTLTSVIFEINEYQDSNAVATTTTDNASTTPLTDSSLPAPDIAAATHHLKDLIQAPDHLSDAGVETKAIKLRQPSVTNFATYLSTATIITPELDRSAAAMSSLPVAWQSNPAQVNQQTKSQQLLVRMPQYATDLCVQLAIPIREFGSTQSEAALTELAVADQIMERIIETLDVKNFGLFTGEG